MAFLTPDKVDVRTVGGHVLTVKQRIMPDSYLAPKYVASYVKAGQPMKPCALLHPANPNVPSAADGVPQGITIHNTPMIKVQTGTDAAEQHVRSTYNGNMNGVIVQYYIWHSEIWQLLADNERGWHATDGISRTLSKDGKSMIGGNVDTISIEAIGSDAETEETTAALTAWLCRKYALLPTEDVYPHRYFFAGKDCPAYILPHWDAFLKCVKTIYLSDEPTEDQPAEWAEASWRWARNMGLINTLKPADVITAQHLAVILDRLESQ